MKIAIFSWRGPGHPYAGGAEIVTHEHAKRWVKEGHQVVLFTSQFKDGLPSEEIDGIKIIRRGTETFGVQLEAFFWYLFSPHPKFDLVVDQFHGIPFFTPLFVRAKKLAFIHEVTKEVWKLNPWPKPLYYLPTFFGPMFEPSIFKLYYKHIHFMTVSQSTKQELTFWSIPEKNITVIPNGVCIPKLDRKYKKEPVPTITFLGALSRDKGIEDALKVFAELAQKGNKYNYWIIGKGDASYLKYLQSYVLKLNLKGKIKFWGYVNNQKKFELLSRSHLLINPSIREGWGLVVIEAAAVGTPTVAYNVPGLKDSVRDNETGILVEQSPKLLVQAVDNLLKNEIKYRQLAKNCLKWSKNFDWDKSGKKSLELINSL